MAGWRDVIGSDLEKFRKDESGNARTADEIIQAALAAALEADRLAGGKGRGGITDAQGNFTPVDDRQLSNEILMQIKSNAEMNRGNTSISEDVYRKLGGNQSEGNFGQYIDPSQWRYGNKIGQIVQGPDDRGPGKVLDRNQKFLSKEELAYYNERVQNPDSKSERYGYVDPVTGFQVAVNPFTGEIDWNRSSDRSAFLNANNPNFPSYYGDEAGGTSFDPVTGLPISKGTGTGSGGGSINSPQNAERKSAYDLLFQEFDRYGLGALVTPLKDLITSGVSPSEFTLRLRQTDAYKNRFAANDKRIKNGLRALSEAEYIRSEDAYQEVMRRRGLPASYYEQSVDPVTGITKQKGFEALLAGDVSSTELEDRIVTGQERVLNANPEVANTLKQFYPGISNGDILAYTLDPANAINEIKRKITNAEIGGAAVQAGLKTDLTRAEELAKYGVTKETAQQGYSAIGNSLLRGSQLASMYGENPYTQTTAEQEVFKVPGAEEARRQRQKITGLEKATFGGQTGVTSGALARDGAGNF